MTAITNIYSDSVPFCIAQKAVDNTSLHSSLTNLDLTRTTVGWKSGRTKSVKILNSPGFKNRATPFYYRTDYFKVRIYRY